MVRNTIFLLVIFFLLVNVIFSLYMYRTPHIHHK